MFWGVVVDIGIAKSVFLVGAVQWKSLPFSPWVEESFICGITPTPARYLSTSIRSQEKKAFQRSAEISVACSGHYEDWCKKQSRNSLCIHDRDFHFSSPWVLLNNHGFHNWSSYMQWRNCLYLVTPKNKFLRWCNHIHVISEVHDWIYSQHLSSFLVLHSLPLLLEGS